MLEIILAGGWLMAPIILCSILALTIIAERFWALRRSNVVPQGLGEQVEEWAARHELDRRHIDQLRSGSALGRVLAAALVNRHRSRDLIKEAVEDTGRHVVYQLERFLNTLGTIAGISPLLGLLGTVIGMIRVFATISAAGLGNPETLSSGISEAMVTTAAGLIIGIPALVAYNWLNGRADRIIFDLEFYSSKVLDTLRRRQIEQTASGHGKPETAAGR